MCPKHVYAQLDCCCVAAVVTLGYGNSPEGWRRMKSGHAQRRRVPPHSQPLLCQFHPPPPLEQLESLRLYALNTPSMLKRSSVLVPLGRQVGQTGLLYDPGRRPKAGLSVPRSTYVAVKGSSPHQRYISTPIPRFRILPSISITLTLTLDKTRGLST